MIFPKPHAWNIRQKLGQVVGLSLQHHGVEYKIAAGVDDRWWAQDWVASAGHGYVSKLNNNMSNDPYRLKGPVPTLVFVILHMPYAK